MDINAIYFLYTWMFDTYNFLMYAFLFTLSSILILSAISTIKKRENIGIVFIREAKSIMPFLAVMYGGICAAIVPFLLLVFAFGKAFAPLPAAG